MSFFTDLISGGAAKLIESTGEAIDSNVTSDHERLQEANKKTNRQLDYAEHRDNQDRDLSLAQNQTNQLTLKLKGWYHSGWRPALGWICGIAFFQKYIIHQNLIWIAAFCEFTPPAPSDLSELIPLLVGMLGIAGMRTIEKRLGVHIR